MPIGRRFNALDVSSRRDRSLIANARGGSVGIGGYPVLMDGGTITAPHFGFYSPEGKWEIENHGVAPDIEVEMDPKAWREGHDPQLEKRLRRFWRR